MNGPVLWLWIGFFALIAVLLALDLFVFHRNAHEVRLREAVGWTVVWIAIGVAFSGVVFAIYEYHWLGAAMSQPKGSGLRAAIEYLTAYVLEKSLSIDNIFVMAVIFSSFRVPTAFQHRILFWGILGAIVARGIMIGAGLWLVEQFEWTFYIFGGFLVITGLRMLVSGGGDDEEGSPGRIVEFARKHLPVAKEYHGSHFIVREHGRLVVTHLFLTLVAIEATDVVFAVDSVPAVLGVSSEPFVVITSNVFAILGLRSLYFVLADMLQRFDYLKHALSVLLVVIGTKMLLHHYVKIHPLISLAIVLVIVSGGIAASLVANQGQESQSNRLPDDPT